MHIQCDKELRNGLQIMKYSVNHYWKFDNYKLAFLPGLLQTIAMLVIIIINFLVIMISGEILDIAKDFTALMIIADFDNIFGNFENSDELPKKILNEPEYEELFKIEKTSSKKARLDGNAKRDAKDDWIIEKVNERRTRERRAQRKENRETKMRFCCRDAKPKKWKQNIKAPNSISLQSYQRDWPNYLLYKLYFFFRVFHVTVWFYALPFIVQIIMYAKPLYRSFNQECLPDDEACLYPKCALDNSLDGNCAPKLNI